MITMKKYRPLKQKLSIHRDTSSRGIDFVIVMTTHTTS